MQSIKVCK